MDYKRTVQTMHQLASKYKHVRKQVHHAKNSERISSATHIFSLYAFSNTFNGKKTAAATTLFLDFYLLSIAMTTWKVHIICLSTQSKQLS
jgi:hypothetical protein